MELKKIRDSIFYSVPDPQYDQPCLYAVVGKDRTLMIDGGVSAELATAFIGELHRQTGRCIDYVAVTHWHWDHIFGLAAIDAPMIVSANTAAHLKAMAGYESWSDEALDARVASGQEIPFCVFHIKKTYPGAARGSIVIRQPDIVFDGAVSLRLGGLTCNIVKLPAVHTDDCIAISVPEAGVLFIGDSTGQNSYDQPAHYSAPAVLALMDFVRASGASIIAESHALPATPEEFWQCNGILETAAKAVLSGCVTVAALSERLRSVWGDHAPDDADEIIELFVNGANRQDDKVL